MNFNPYNFENKIRCEKGCQEEQSNNHIFDGLKANNQETELKFEDILNGTLKQKILTFRKFQENNRTQLWDST